MCHSELMTKACISEELSKEVRTFPLRAEEFKKTIKHSPVTVQQQTHYQHLIELSKSTGSQDIIQQQSLKEATMSLGLKEKADPYTAAFPSALFK